MGAGEPGSSASGASGAGLTAYYDILAELRRHTALLEQIVSMLPAPQPNRTVQRECLHCHKHFSAGPGTGRRYDAKFCLEEHRAMYHNLRRSKAGKEHRERV